MPPPGSLICYTDHMKAVAISELQQHLSDYVQLVDGGESVLVSDGGKIVAELRKPPALEPQEARHTGLMELAREGRVRLGLPNEPGLYPPRPVRRRAGVAARLLNEERGER